VASLTEQQQKFVTHYTSDPGAIGNASEAARRAGYSDKSSREIGRQLLDKRHVQTAVREANQQQISGQLATKAVALLEKVIDDEAVPIKVRVDAAKTVLDRAGFGASQTPTGPSWRDKHPSEMSDEELDNFLREAQAAMARGNREPAPLIDVTPEPESLPMPRINEALHIAAER
jgi:hypothetical protein